MKAVLNIDEWIDERLMKRVMKGVMKIDEKADETADENVEKLMKEPRPPFHLAGLVPSELLLGQLELQSDHFFNK